LIVENTKRNSVRVRSIRRYQSETSQIPDLEDTNPIKFNQPQSQTPDSTNLSSFSKSYLHPPSQIKQQLSPKILSITTPSSVIGTLLTPISLPSSFSTPNHFTALVYQQFDGNNITARNNSSFILLILLKVSCIEFKFDTVLDWAVEISETERMWHRS